jgi:hypothetical protein
MAQCWMGFMIVARSEQGEGVGVGGDGRLTSSASKRIESVGCWVGEETHDVRMDGLDRCVFVYYRERWRDDPLWVVVWCGWYAEGWMMPEPVVISAPAVSSEKANQGWLRIEIL